MITSKHATIMHTESMLLSVVIKTEDAAINKHKKYPRVFEPTLFLLLITNVIKLAGINICK